MDGKRNENRKGTGSRLGKVGRTREWGRREDGNEKKERRKRGKRS